MVMLQISDTLLNQIYTECRKQYPNEACGFVLGESGAKSTSVQVVPCKNIQNELHQKDPARYPRDAKTAYTIDPEEMKKIEEKYCRGGVTPPVEIIAIFHSHPEHGVYFSDEDKGMAAPWGEPLFPGLSYLVVSVYGGEVKNASDFYWDGEKKDFVERKIL